MPKTAAERQRTWRDRRNRRLAELESAAAAHETAVAMLTTDLEAARAECERLGAQACRHPAGAVDNGTCRACGTDVW